VNRQRQAQLRKRLHAFGYDTIAAVARHPANNWPAEPGFWVPGILQWQAHLLAKQFRQNALVYFGSNGVPTLFWCVRAQAAIVSLHIVRSPHKTTIKS
jgi:hypothetical protein